MVPDKDSDIKPRFHKAKSHSQKHQDGEEVIVLFYLVCIEMYYIATYQHPYHLSLLVFILFS